MKKLVATGKLLPSEAQQAGQNGAELPQGAQEANKPLRGRPRSTAVITGFSVGIPCFPAFPCVSTHDLANRLPTEAEWE
jgi:hypothetical protein